MIAVLTPTQQAAHWAHLTRDAVLIFDMTFTFLWFIGMLLFIIFASKR